MTYHHESYIYYVRLCFRYSEYNIFTIKKLTLSSNVNEYTTVFIVFSETFWFFNNSIIICDLYAIRE